MTQKDFKVKKGLVVGGNIASNTNGFLFEYDSNALSIAGQAIALQANVNLVQDNVASIAGGSTAGTDAVQDNLNIFASNAIANTNTVSSNVDSLETSVNTILANVNAVSDNVDSAISTAAANDYTTYTTLISEINTVSGNVDSLETSVNTILANVNSVQDNVATVSTQLDSFGTYANSTFTTNTHVDTKIAELVDGSPELLNTLNELAAAIGDDPNFAATLASQVGAAEANVVAVDTRLTANINTVSSNVDSLETSVNTIAANVNSVSDNVAAIVDGTTPFTGPVTFNDNISADRAILNTQLQIGSNVTTGVGTGETAVFTFPGATYRGAELLMMVQDITNTEYQLSKILVVHDGTSVYTTEYGVLHTGTSDLTTFSAAIDGSDVVTVSSTGGSANKKITVASHYLIQ